MTVRFSIIIPVYNVAPYLRKCLDSVLASAKTLSVGVASSSSRMDGGVGESSSLSSSSRMDGGVGESSSLISSSRVDGGVVTSSSLSSSSRVDGGVETPPTADQPTTNNQQPLVEIICVDDGSTDGSGGILDEYGEKLKCEVEVEERSCSSSEKDDPTTVQLQLSTSTKKNDPTTVQLQLPTSTQFRILHQKNAGVSAARNAGLRVAKGDWILFVDADDVVSPTWLIEIAEQIKDKGSDELVAFDKIEFAGEKLKCEVEVEDRKRLECGVRVREKLECGVRVRERCGSSSDEKLKCEVEVEERNCSSSEKNETATVQLQLPTSTKENDPTTVQLQLPTSTKENDPTTVQLQLRTSTKKDETSTVQLQLPTSTKKEETSTVQLQLSTSTKDESADLRLRLSTSTKIIDLTHAIPSLMGQLALYQFAYPREMIRDLRFKPYVVGEDLLFVANALAVAKSVDYIAQPLYAYRHRAGSAVRSAISPRKLHDRIRYVPEMLEVLSRSGKRIDSVFSRTRANGWLEGVPSSILTTCKGSDPLYDDEGRVLMREWRESLARAKGIGCLSAFNHFRARINRVLPFDWVVRFTCVLPRRLKLALRRRRH